MSVVKVEKNRYIAEPLYQWDLNQVLEIRGLSLARVPEIHFRNETMSRAIVRQARMDSAGIITADIPNSLLQVPYKVLAYVCAYEGETFESLFKIEIPVTARKKPMDYTLVDDEEIYSFNALENQVVNALADMNNAIDRSEQNLEKAVAEYEAAIGNIAKAKEEIIDTLTPEDIGASPSEHEHDASDIKSGTVLADRLPVVPVNKGGTGATDALAAIINLNGVPVINASGASYDMNDILDTGVYGWYRFNGDTLNTAYKEGLTAATIGYILNLPTGNTSGTRYGTQLAIHIGDNHLYCRCIYNETPTPWIKILRNTDIIPVDKGGTGAVDADTARKNLGAVNKDGDTIAHYLKIAMQGDDEALSVERTTFGEDIRFSFMVTEDGEGVITWSNQTTGAFGQMGIDLDGNVYMSKPLGIENGGTGATTAADARTNLGTSFSGEVPYSAIDNITESGFYRVTSSTAKENGALIHFASNGMHRQLADFHNDGLCMMTRMRYSSGSWGAWDKVFDTTQAIPVANGGTGAKNAADARTNLGVPSKISHTLLWGGNAGNGVTVSLADSLLNFDMFFVSFEGAFSNVKQVDSGCTWYGHSFDIVDDSKNTITYACKMEVLNDGSQIKNTKCSRIVHAPGSNHNAAADTYISAIYGIKLG